MGMGSFKSPSSGQFRMRRGSKSKSPYKLKKPDAVVGADALLNESAQMDPTNPRRAKHPRRRKGPDAASGADALLNASDRAWMSGSGAGTRKG